MKLKFKIENQCKTFWKKTNLWIVFLILSLIFLSFTIYLSTNLRTDVLPDEYAHFVFSKHFSSTLGIPTDTAFTTSQGWYIQHNPYLYHWINGRLINFYSLIFPLANDWQILVFLRIISSIYSLGTVIFCFLLSKELIKNKWLQLLPPFMLTNTLMFVFLSGGVSYDNLANLCSIAGLFYFVKVLKSEKILFNSLLWLIFICLGTLVKYTILPLALIMTIIWLIFVIKNSNLFSLIDIKKPKIISLLIIFFFLVIGNLSIYGVNLMKYGRIIPHCIQMFPENVCEISPYVERYNSEALGQKMSIVESIYAGFPNPVKYFFDVWIDYMLNNIYGILAHLSYFPSYITILYRLFFLWLIMLAFKYWNDPPFIIYSFVAIFLFYLFVLFIQNYNSELTYGFKQISVQGRYLFPVINLLYLLVAYTLEKVNNRIILVGSTLFVIGLFIIGGPIKFIVRYDTIFINWFVN